jgi:hypothetical protein
MWQSKDLASVIIFAVLGLIFTLFVTQTATLITGEPMVGYFFIVGYAVFISAQLLLFEGRRWRFAVSSILFVFLIIPTSFAGAPFDVLARVPLMFNAIVTDLLFTSIYGFFRMRNKLLLLTIIISVEFHSAVQFFSMLFLYLFYPLQALTEFINILLFVFPVIIIESLIGGYIGYIVYQRVKGSNPIVNTSYGQN